MNTGRTDSLLAKDVKKGKLSQSDADATRSRVSTITSLEAIGDAEIIIEAAPEKLEIKQSIFASLAQHASPTAILASNTSSISLTKIAASAITSNSTEEAAKSSSPARVLGCAPAVSRARCQFVTAHRLHFFNPVPVMKLVELISALQTSPEVVERARAFAVACGKTVAVAQDTPGCVASRKYCYIARELTAHRFVSNRVLMPMINEAIICLESGTATKDGAHVQCYTGTAAQCGARHRHGHEARDGASHGSSGPCRLVRKRSLGAWRSSLTDGAASA